MYSNFVFQMITDWTAFTTRKLLYICIRTNFVTITTYLPKVHMYNFMHACMYTYPTCTWSFYHLYQNKRCIARCNNKKNTFHLIFLFHLIKKTSYNFSDKISATILVETLLGSTEDVKNFQKYRRMASEHVGNKLILQQYETAKAKVGFKLLGIYNKMKLFPNDLTMLQQLKNMLEHWGISTRYW